MSQLQVTGEAKIRDLQGPVVSNSGVISALDGAASQYVRGDGTLADFPTSSGGGSSVSYYLNSSVSQGTIGGVAYRELSKEPIIGAGTDIAISSNGYVANYITDVNDPDVILIPGGNFNCEFYFSVNNNSGNPFFYAELYKYDGTTFTLLGSSVGVPEYITQGTTIAPYYFAIPVATANLALTDRLAIRIYVNVSGRTITLHTENGHLCQVVTTLSKGMVSLNNLTDQSQFLTTGTSGTNFAIVSTGDTHTFNLPIASAANTGKLSSTDWSTFNAKQPAGNYVTLDTTQTITAAKTFNLGIKAESGIFLKELSSSGRLAGYVGISATATGGMQQIQFLYPVSGSSVFSLPTTGAYNYEFPIVSGTIALTSNIPANPVGGTGTTNTLPKFTGTSTIGNSNITDTGSLITLGSNTFVTNNLGLGNSSLTQYGFRNSLNVTGAGNSIANYSDGQILSGVVGRASYYETFANTAAAAFTNNGLYHYRANQSTFGAGSTVVNQYGFSVEATLVGATNNYGFFGNIPSGTNRWNLYMAGTAPNFLNGSLLIGTTTTGTYQLDVMTSGIAGIIDVAKFGALGNGGAGRGVGIVLGASGSSSTVSVARLVAYQETASATANNASFAIQVANSSGTLTEYLRINNAGSVLIGATNTGSSNLRISKTITGGTTWYGTRADGQVQSDVTAVANNFASFLNTAATSFTLAEYAHYSAQQGTIGAGSIINNQYGFLVTSSLTGASNNYGFVGGLSASGTSRWNLYMNGTAPNYLAGALGIGNTGLTGYNLRISLNPSAATAYGIMQDGVALSSVTTSYHINRTLAQTQAATFTLTELAHYYATQAAFGAGSTVSNQYGFITGNLSGGVANFGFYGNIASAVNNWNLYMNGTANNYLAGSLGIGDTSLTGYTLRVSKNITGATSSYGIRQAGIVQSDVTADAIGFRNDSFTAASAFTLTNYWHFWVRQGTLGAGSAITNQFGFHVDSNMIGATNTYAYSGAIPSGSNRWNLYMSGTAANYLAGTLSIGTTSTSYALTVQGAIYANTDGSSVGLYVNSNGAVRGLGTLYIDTASGSNADLIFRPNIAEALRMKPNGNILIGTTTDAGFKLNVNGTGRFTGDVELNGASGTRTLTIQNNTSGNAVLSLVAAGSDSGSITYNRSTSQLVFANSSVSNAMVITNGGNVGIGTSSPNSVLEVAGTSSLSDFRISRTVSSSTYFFIKAPGGSPSASQLGVNGTDVMTLNASGNVGIGTTSTSTKLNVVDSSFNQYSLRVESATGNTANRYGGIGLAGEAANTKAAILFVSDGSSFSRGSIVFSNNNASDQTNADLTTERVRINSNGNLLVNTTTDNGQGKLQVNGAITANNISYTGELVTTSTTFNTTYYHIISGAVGSGQTYTLPSPSSNNLQYVVINKSNFSQTISAGSGFTIYNMAGSDVGSITLASKARCFIIADGSGFYQIF